MKVIKHELVRPLQPQELWENTDGGPQDLMRTPCAATVQQRPCKNHATHQTRGKGSRRTYVNLCFAHAVAYIEGRTSDLMHEGMIHEQA